MAEEKTYGNGILSLENQRLLSSGRVSETDSNLFLTDIAQSRFFTVTLDKLQNNGVPIKFKFPKPLEEEYLPEHRPVNTWEDFFPVKDISLSFTSYNNLSIPFNVFGNFPLLHRKQLTTITINSYDITGDLVEKAVQQWEESCFPKSKYVAYLSKIASVFEYKSYRINGSLSYIKKLHVIPTGTVSVNRGYDANSEKIVSFSVIAVGEPGASASGTGGNLINSNGHFMKDNIS